MDRFNLPNRPNFGRPNLQRGNAAFGRISGAGGARLIQFDLRLEFSELREPENAPCGRGSVWIRKTPNDSRSVTEPRRLGSGVWFAFSALLVGILPADALDLRNALIAADSNLSRHEGKAVQVLVQEVERRTGLRWLPSGSTPGGPVIRIHRGAGTGPAEGFRLSVTSGAVNIQGNDARGTLFGVGRFLRELRWDRGRAEIPDGLDIVSSPKYRLRGHQLGYRPKTNTYDAWTPVNFEQYVRDLVAFGANAVELIPPRSDDDDDSPHFTLPKMEMMVEMSRILDEYGLQVWIWHPAMDPDYTNPRTVESALKEWGEVFRQLRRVDAVFVPGGDPGHTHPKVLLGVLEKQARLLRQFHPKAQMWVSAQNFDADWVDEFLALVNTGFTWLDGVSYGPGTRISLPQLRERLNPRYPIRRYPDITHSTYCEYPVPGWDLAYAMTEGREPINPRPVDQAKIFQLTSPASTGFITYSEGVNDDVNKFVWSGLGWDPNVDVTQILREYARYFIHSRFEEAFAQGLLSLERNWRGPLAANRVVETTLQQFQAMERAATPQMLLNWRFQQAVYRAYYDAYIRRRLIYETHLEEQALDRLAEASRVGSSSAVDIAERILDEAVAKPVASELRGRIFTLAEALFQSIGMQLSVDRYRAVAVNRGANLDTVDFPLNNRFWLKERFSEIRRKSDDDERMALIRAILNRTNPGPGGFYDDLGNIDMQPHLVNEGPGYDKDPAGFQSTRSGYAFYGGRIARTSRDAIRPDGPARFLQTPTAWWTYAETQYETPLTMRYDHVDPGARYAVRVVYYGGRRDPRVRLVANDSIEIHPWIEKAAVISPMEFEIPPQAVKLGILTLRWFTEPRRGGFSSAVRIAEVFLIRK